MSNVEITTGSALNIGSRASKSKQTASDGAGRLTRDDDMKVAEDNATKDIFDTAILFARSDSIYKSLPGCDVWDIERDARLYDGIAPVVVHPPCRSWGRMRQFANPRHDEKDLARFAVLKVRSLGGVLEHPAESTLWGDQLMPFPGRAPDQWGGWTMAVDQFHFGHRAEKSTWLYIVGIHPDDLPPVPHRDGSPTHCIRPTKSYPRLPSVTKPERERTPPALAEWLVKVAAMCGSKRD